MKLFAVSIAATFLFGSMALAQDTKTGADSAVSALTGKEKKTRKKKVEMCAECGKPESECDCETKGTKHKPAKDADSKSN
ncbi:MAG: hypothetical protein EOP06_06425 [Proteobacteria bacterium]|nr:MAG: hypothetical protein EOP06_06425 [Pseudomonadota bacterium]